MPIINIDYQVFMTYGHAVPAATTIGTDGLGPCLGIVARRNDGQIFCGHLACSLAGLPANKDRIKAAAKAILLANVGAADAVGRVDCASSQNDPTMRWMFEAAQETYADVGFQQGFGIYWNGAAVAVVDMATELSGAVKGPHDDAGPLDVA